MNIRTETFGKRKTYAQRKNVADRNIPFPKATINAEKSPNALESNQTNYNVSIHGIKFEPLHLSK